MDRLQKQRPPYAIASVDHALRLAAMLQLEGPLTVSEVAERLGVARSTAHRLLAMLVYRDFAVQTTTRAYGAGPLLELASHSRSATSRLRAAALPHLVDLVDAVEESANLIIRAGTTARFIASVECSHALRVGNREGMVFPAHRVSGGLVLLSELRPEQVTALYAPEHVSEEAVERPDVDRLLRELKRIRKAGFALNHGRSERGVVALGVPVRGADGQAVAGLSISVPSVRYSAHSLPGWLGHLARTAAAIETDLGGRD